MSNLHEDIITIGSDIPQTNPALDAFGYSMFAQRIADSVYKTPSPQGLVMAKYGPWDLGNLHCSTLIPTHTSKPAFMDLQCR